MDVHYAVQQIQIIFYLPLLHCFLWYRDFGREFLTVRAAQCPNIRRIEQILQLLHSQRRFFCTRPSLLYGEMRL